MYLILPRIFQMRLDELIWITVLKPTTTALPQSAHDKESAERNQQAAFFPSETTGDPSSLPYGLSRPRILIHCLLWNHPSGSAPSYSSPFLHPLMETPSYRCLFSEIDEFLGMPQWLPVLLRMSDSDHSFNCQRDSSEMWEAVRGNTELEPHKRREMHLQK